jgi:hypothetical protein
MRIALHQAGDTAMRAGQILLAEPDLETLGLVDRPPRSGRDPRVVRADDLEDYDLLVTDAVDDLGHLVDRALDAGISLCTWSEIAESEDGSRPGDNVADLDDELRGLGLSLLSGSNLASGVAPCLAAHETIHDGEVLDVTIAWTEPGSGLRRGEAIPFPEPVGARWARPRRSAGGHAYVAPLPGPWAAAMARVTAATDDGVITRVVGVADFAGHLEAIALAAGAVAAARGAYPPGIVTADEAAGSYLAAALAAGLDIAAYVHHEA